MSVGGGTMSPCPLPLRALRWSVVRPSSPRCAGRSPGCATGSLQPCSSRVRPASASRGCCESSRRRSSRPPMCTWAGASTSARRARLRPAHRHPPLHRHAHGRRRVRESVGVGAEALGMLLPELVDSFPTDRDRTSPERLRDAIASLIEAAAERAPQVLVVEDLHWADESTLAILSFLLRALGRGRILLLITCRSDDVRRGDAVSRFIGEATRARLLEHVTTSPGSTTPPCASWPSRSPAARSPRQRSTVCRSGPKASPSSSKRSPDARTGPLPDGLRDILLARFDGSATTRVTSCRSPPAPSARCRIPLLTRLTDIPEQRLDEAMREAARSGILVVVDD
jgi:hypothetical protein